MQETLNKKDIFDLGRGSVLAFIGAIVYGAFGFLLQWIIGRTLGPESVGEFGLSISVANLIIVLVAFGLDQGILKFGAHYSGLNDTEQVSSSIWASLQISILASVILIPLLMLTSRPLSLYAFNQPIPTSLLRLFILAAPVVALMRILVEALRSVRRLDLKVIVDKFLFAGLQVLIVLLGFFLIGRSIQVVGYAYLVAAVGALIVAALFAFRVGVFSIKSIKLTTGRAKGLLAFSLPLMLLSLVNRANNESETLLLGILTNKQETGLYYIGLKLSSLVAIVLTSLNAMTAPMLAEFEADKNHAGMEKVYQTITRWGIILSAPVIIMLLVFAEGVLSIFGQEFVAASSLLRVLVLSQVVFILTGPSGWLLTMSGYPRLNFYNSLAALFIAVGLDLWLVPKLGGLGAAIGGGGAIVLFNVLKLLQAKHILDIHPFDRRLLKPMVVGFACLSLFFLGQSLIEFEATFLNLILVALAVSGFYVSGLLLLGLEAEEKILFGQLWQLVRSKDR